MKSLNDVVDLNISSLQVKRNRFNSSFNEIPKDLLGQGLEQINTSIPLTEDLFYKVKIQGNKLVKA